MKHHLLTRALLLLTLLLSLVSAKGYATLTEEEIQERLSKPYEQNADEIIELIRQQQFEDAEAFIEYVVAHDYVTRDGIRYFRAMLEHWFFASEVREFNRTFPVSQDLLPYLEAWIENTPQSANAHIIRGVYYIERAWEIRSRKWAKDVKQEAWEDFHELHLFAKQDLEKAYEIDSSNPHSSRQLIRVQRALDAEDVEATELYFQRATRHHPTFYWAYRAKLENIMPKWGGTWESMFDFASETAENAPPNTLLPLILAHAIEEAAARSQNTKQFYQNPEAWETLESIYKLIIDDFPLSSLWKVRFAQRAVHAGKYDVAMEYLHLAEVTDPDNYRVYELKAQIFERQQNWKSEEKNARKLIQLCPLYENGYAQLGYALSKQGQHKKSAEVFSQVIEINPQKAWYWSRRCYDYRKLEKYKQVISDCTKAIELDKNNSAPYWNRGFAYEKIGNQEAAEADYEMAKKIREARN